MEMIWKKRHPSLTSCSNRHLVRCREGELRQNRKDPPTQTTRVSLAKIEVSSVVWPEPRPGSGHCLETRVSSGAVSERLSVLGVTFVPVGKELRVSVAVYRMKAKLLAGRSHCVLF